ncbi:hypothetical protein BH11MYX4_BH11MYX4_17120 [soil metagenome]
MLHLARVLSALCLPALFAVMACSSTTSSTASPDGGAEAGGAASCETSMAGQICVRGNTCAGVQTCDGPGPCTVACTTFQLECQDGTWKQKSLPVTYPPSTDPACAADAAAE